MTKRAADSVRRSIALFAGTQLVAATNRSRLHGRRATVRPFAGNGQQLNKCPDNCS